MLSDAHRAFYRAFGYLHLRGALAQDIGWITAAFEATWAARPDLVHTGEHTTDYPGIFIASRPELAGLLAHPVIVGALGALLGDSWSTYGGDGSLKTGDTPWHSDCVYMPRGWEAKSTTPHLKVAFYLDPLTQDTGALRVIPGSHLHGDAYAGVLDTAIYAGALGVEAHAIPSVTLASQPGDLILFDHRLKHAAFGGGTRRRQFAINCIASCHDERRSEAARQILRGYRDLQRIDWRKRPGWLEWIASLPPAVAARFHPAVEFGLEVMAEGERAARADASCLRSDQEGTWSSSSVRPGSAAG